MAIKCLGDRVLIQVSESEEKAGGIIIPDSAQEKQQKGKVVSVGPGSRDEKGQHMALEVKEGDTVLYSKYSGTEVTYKDEEYLIVKESDILAIVD